MKIYTKKGDKGMTSLFGGEKVPKFHDRIEAYGTVDELNSFLALLRDSLTQEDIRGQLLEVQNYLFNLGSHLATPPDKQDFLPNLDESKTTMLESSIDEMEAQLAPLKNFILPGGHPVIALGHIARTVCRRAERRVVGLSNNEEIDPHIPRYLNRLSDYLFVLTRYLAHILGVAEIEWKK